MEAENTSELTNREPGEIKEITTCLISPKCHIEKHRWLLDKLSISPNARSSMADIIPHGM